MQTATFIKTIKWLYAQEMDDALDYFRTGYREYLDSGRSAIMTRIEDTYTRGIHLNTRVKEIEEHTEATALLDAFGLSLIYDVDWWQSVVSTFLRILATNEDDETQADTAKEIFDNLDMFSERMRILVSCVGPLQQLVVPTSVLRLTDYDDVLTLDVHSSTGAGAPTIERMEAVLQSASEIYSTMCRIHGLEEPEPLRVLHMSSESGFRFDFSGDATIILDLKKLLVDVWIRIRNQDTPHIKDLNRVIVTNLAPCQKIEERLASGEVTQEIAGQLRHQLSALAMKMFDHGVQIREIPDTDTVDNRHLMEQISQRRLPQPIPTAEEPASPASATKAKSKPRTRKTAAKKTSSATTSRSRKSPAKSASKSTSKTTKQTKKRKAA